MSTNCRQKPRRNSYQSSFLIYIFFGMAGKEIALGTTGETLIKNLKRVRGEMTYAELARRLEALGRPIPPLGLRRMEAGERRVDVDDLMALAMVLHVSPLTLLLPQGQESDTSVFGDKPIRNDHLWRWAIGDRSMDGSETRRFQADSLPSWLDVRGWTKDSYILAKGPGGGEWMMVRDDGND